MHLADYFVDKYKAMIKREFGLTDETGLIISSSSSDKKGTVIPEVAGEDKDIFSQNDMTFKRVLLNEADQGFVYVTGSDTNAKEMIEILSSLYSENKISSMITPEKEDIYNRLIEGNIHKDKIRDECQKSGIDFKRKRVVYVFKIDDDTNSAAPEVLRSLFPENGDEVLVHKSTLVVLIKKHKQKETVSDYYKTAKIATETISGELMLKVSGGIGLPAEDASGIRESFEQAVDALYTGMAFENEIRYYYYGKLGLGRIIKNIDKSIAADYLNEIAGEGEENVFDEQTLFVARKLFENNLNISEASKKSYLHRNTLMYRLEKLQRLTGLDLRKFDDAVIFKIAMLIKIYSERTEKHD